MNQGFAIDYMDQEKKIWNQLGINLPGGLGIGDVGLRLSHYNGREGFESTSFNAAYRLIGAMGNTIDPHNVDILYVLCRGYIQRNMPIVDSMSCRIGLWMPQVLRDLNKDYHIRFTKQPYGVAMHYHGLQGKEGDPSLTLSEFEGYVKDGKEKNITFYITDQEVQDLKGDNINLDYTIKTTQENLHKLFAMILQSNNI